jgi:demethylmenaquinone methyltransferase/2-methoxy-6-polyprenyl-1,4-benzoquinol methylase
VTASTQIAAKHSAAGARPDGASGEQEAASQVREMFGGIAPRYDLLNHLLSLNMDRLWRRRLARRFQHVLNHPDALVLDVCCGTGDLTLALARRGRATLIGSDFAHPMLVRAEGKSRGKRKQNQGEGNIAGYIEADALSLPFSDGGFDLVTAAFGFRNLANYDRGLRELRRVLKPGGEIAILEFSEPQGAVLGRIYRFYFTRILPRVGRAISGNSFAYSYLPNSVEKFPAPEDLAKRMSRVGFTKPSYELWTGGSVALYRATKG